MHRLNTFDGLWGSWRQNFKCLREFKLSKELYLPWILFRPPGMIIIVWMPPWAKGSIMILRRRMNPSLCSHRCRECIIEQLAYLSFTLICFSNLLSNKRRTLSAWMRKAHYYSCAKSRSSKSFYIKFKDWKMLADYRLRDWREVSTSAWSSSSSPIHIWTARRGAICTPTWAQTIQDYRMLKKRSEFKNFLIWYFFFDIIQRWALLDSGFSRKSSRSQRNLKNKTSIRFTIIF